MASKALIIGSSGQIGTELALRLREIKGNENVVASDIRKGSYEVMESGPFEFLDVTSEQKEVIEKMMDAYEFRREIPNYPTHPSSMQGDK